MDKMIWLPTSLVKEPAPIAELAKPSSYSGENFTTLARNPWDFSGGDDLLAIQCVDWSLSESFLNLTIASPGGLPPECGDAQPETDPP